MKNNKTVRLVVLLLFIAIVTAVVISGTFAKYTTSSGNNAATATIAQWSFAADGFGTAVTTSINADNLTSGRIAPGVSGTIGARIDVAGCEVGVNYRVIITDIVNKPTNLVFKNGGTAMTPVYVNAALETCQSTDTGAKLAYVATGSLTVTQINAITEESGHKYQNVGLTFEWPYETTDGDAADTTNGTTAGDMTFNVVVIGTQANPANS